MTHHLRNVLIAVGESPPQLRSQYVDEVAKHGREAIVALIPWLLDPHFAVFAVQVIERVGLQGDQTAAVAALRSAAALNLPPESRGHVEAAMRRLVAEPSRRRGTPSQERALLDASSTLDALIPGHVYSRRTELHGRGLGGNWQKGISYPRDGHYALLFSNPARANEFGYRDGPVGADRYRYFGEWHGTGDMALTGGNRVIVERSPHLYLFVKHDGGQRFIGQFALDRWDVEQTTRDGSEFAAIVFVLVRVR